MRVSRPNTATYHGIPAAIAFVTFLVWVFLASARRRDALGFAAHTVLLVALLQTFIYGLSPYGLPIIALAIVLALRPGDPQQSGSSGKVWPTTTHPPGRASKV
jgi:hypothetical protein